MNHSVARETSTKWYALSQEDVIKRFTSGETARAKRSRSANATRKVWNE